MTLLLLLQREVKRIQIRPTDGMPIGLLLALTTTGYGRVLTYSRTSKTGRVPKYGRVSKVGRVPRV